MTNASLLPRLALLDDDELTEHVLRAATDARRFADPDELPRELRRFGALGRLVQRIEASDLASWLVSVSAAEVEDVAELAAHPELSDVHDVLRAALAVFPGGSVPARGVDRSSFLRGADERLSQLARDWQAAGESAQWAKLGRVLRPHLGAWVQDLSIDADALPALGVARAPRGRIAIEVLDPGSGPRAPLRYAAGATSDTTMLEIDEAPPRREVGGAGKALEGALAASARTATSRTARSERAYVATVVDARDGELTLSLRWRPLHEVARPLTLAWNARGPRVPGIDAPRVQGVPEEAARLAATYLLSFPEAPLGQGARFRARYRSPAHGETTVDVRVDAVSVEGARLSAEIETTHARDGRRFRRRARARIAVGGRRWFPEAVVEEEDWIVQRFPGGGETTTGLARTVRMAHG